MNLFLNALEAMGPHGTLTVATELQPSGSGQVAKLSRIAVKIQDTGVGFGPENTGRLFVPFFTTKPGGTGLGLPITQRIVHEHRGSINVESEPSKGASFTIIFPVVEKGR